MKIDARGIACPQPVLMIKDELDKIEEGVITIMVDNKGSSINVKNFCESNGHTATVNEKDGCYSIVVAKGYDCAIAEEKSESNIVVFISGECVGNEEPELGKMLMKGFIGNIKNLDNKPKTVIFVNNGVRMLTTNEETIALVKEIADMGIEVLACGACLEYFKLVDYLKVGVVSDAYTVSNKLFNADKVIRL
ncbi:MAG: sulfurtransferase-like selenium metabolism protein YedF [Denitrovibrio sp.]|nr:MAG: sulfurtransferase-like selenium metabolism protein YedF [Denitrovibrio sp.]